MKIAFIIHSLCIGGAEKIAVEYLIKLKEQGHDVRLVEFRHVESVLCARLKNADIPITTLLQANNGFFAKVKYKLFMRKIICKRLNAFLQTEHFDILHIHTSLECLRRIDFDITKIFYSFHTSVHRNLSVIARAHNKNLFRYARSGMNFLVLGNEMKRDAQKVLPTEKIYILPNGLDFAQIKAQVYERGSFLPSIGVPPNAFVLCHVARMHPVKNHVKTIEVFNEVVKRKPDAYLLLIGQTECKELKKVNNLISRYGLNERVKILGNRSDATAILGISDAMILPSFAEGFSLVAVEAQVLGIRSVLTDSVPNEVICNDNCFTLSVDEDDSKWADLLCGDFTEKHNDRLQDFDIDCIVKKLLDYYGRVISTGKN